MSTDLLTDPVVDAVYAAALELHPQVALRPEPFGALAYHYGNRRLVFLKHHDVVAVVRCLHEHPSVGAALDACGVAPERRPSFARAIASLQSSEILVQREVAR